MGDSEDNSMVRLWEVIGTAFLKNRTASVSWAALRQISTFWRALLLVEMACSGIERSVNDILYSRRRNSL